MKTKYELLEEPTGIFQLVLQLLLWITKNNSISNISLT